MNKKKNSWFLDQYKNPSETSHTISEVMKWFKKNNIQYLSSSPINFNPEDKLFEKKETQESIVKNLNIDLNKRPEELSNEMFYKIALQYERLSD